MNKRLLGIVAGIAVTAVAVWWYFRNRAQAAVSSPADDGISTGEVFAMGDGNGSGVGSQFDSLIAAVAAAEGVSPIVLKAIVAKESYFDPNAINPEKGFTIQGVAYTQYSATGRTKLISWIKAGNNPASLGINPSIGLCQTRVATTAQVYMPGVTAQQLFDPVTSLTCGARFLADLFSKGYDLDSIDVYNVGETAFRSGSRNLAYQQQTLKYANQFSGDF